MKLLKIDIDFKPPKEWFDLWKQTRVLMLNYLGLRVEYIKKFETRRGIHVYVKLVEDVTDEDANLLQFLLGDDATRVKINQWRIKRGVRRWNKLFHKVLYRRKPKTLTCYYCGNVIPVPERWFQSEKKL